MGELARINADKLPGPVTSTFAASLTSLSTLWGRLRRDADFDQRATEAAIAEAEALTPAMLDEVREQGRIASAKEQSTFLRMLVSAWPNASQADLAGYGLQLAQDLEEQRPSRHALTEAARQLRRTSRFLPSICEVLEAIAAAEKPIRNVLSTMDRIAPELDSARLRLGDLRDRIARWERRAHAQASAPADESGSSDADL